MAGALASRAASASEEAWNVEAGLGLGGIVYDSDTHTLGQPNLDPNIRRDPYVQPKQFGGTLALRAGFQYPGIRKSFLGIVPGIELEVNANANKGKTETGAIDQWMYHWYGILSLTLGYPVADDRLVPFLLGGFGLVRLTSSDPPQANGGDTGRAWALGFGAKYELVKDGPYQARLDLRYYNTNPNPEPVPPQVAANVKQEGNGTDELQGLISFAYVFGKKKAEVIPPPADSDGDGVTDDKDKCPGTPKGDKVDATGCSLPKDSDGDGVTDDKDQCPGTPAGEKVDARGCPLPKDSDGDGVTDDKDECPATPTGTQVDARGCPLPPPIPDQDGDGIPDDKDRCPQDKGTPEYDGCPPDRYLEGTFEGIVFKTGKAVLDPAAYPILDKIARILKEQPQLRIEVQGHTDSKGKRVRNIALSKKRAMSVKRYLMKKKIKGNRIKIVGFGPDKPKFPNDTEEGRAKNRRIDLKTLPPLPVKAKKGKKIKKGKNVKGVKAAPQ